ncbi:cation:proton antiporter [Noviherbaspirillum denitrificans]|uniref:Sodium:proton antiporter n=1 Tax=Noviherbaspirillum denitrificans TaxID=1968433 RepID=A0A254TC75_9BURK|nr:sodium:proton antiporter [Noviherbaspirillum denitrificans]
MGLLGTIWHRLPLSPAMLYLPIGFALGPSGAGLVTLDPYGNAALLTLLTEIALLISLFTVGLKLRVPLADRIWRLPLRLGVVGMLVTSALLALAGFYVFGLPPGIAVLLGAILSPTDPVLASDVQVHDAGDRDRLRFSLSGEGGMNDGTAYPVVMLGLFLLGVEEARDYGSRWAPLMAMWGILAGFGSGFLLSRGVVRLALHLRQHYHKALGMEEFLTLGLIAASYGVSHLVHGVGFIAVFAAGVAMRRIEHERSGTTSPTEMIGAVPAGDAPAVATHPQKAPAYMAETVLGFNQQLEHIAEFVMVLLLGIMLSAAGFSLDGVIAAALLFLVVRPVSVVLALLGEKTGRTQRVLMAWFGIRGIGSLYYLVFALQYDWAMDMKQRLVSMVLTAVAISILLHGISATPLMERYHRRRQALVDE